MTAWLVVVVLTHSFPAAGRPYREHGRTTYMLWHLSAYQDLIGTDRTHRYDVEKQAQKL